MGVSLTNSTMHLTAAPIVLVIHAVNVVVRREWHENSEDSEISLVFADELSCVYK
jgi:hypothetical protein